MCVLHILNGLKGQILKFGAAPPETSGVTMWGCNPTMGTQKSLKKMCFGCSVLSATRSTISEFEVSKQILLDRDDIKKLGLAIIMCLIININ